MSKALPSSQEQRRRWLEDPEKPSTESREAKLEWPRRKLKIGFFLPNATFDLPGTPEVGGIESFTFTVGEAMQKLGHEVVLFGGAPKAGRSHRPTSLTLELHPYWETGSIPDIGTRFQRLIQRLHFGWSIRKGWATQRCDAVILAKPFDWPVAWAWKRSRPDLRVVMGFHGTDFFSGDRNFYPAVDRAFAVSRTVADLAEKRIKKRPVLIPNPVDTDLFSPGEGRQEKSLWHVVASGRLVGWKGFGQLLEAWAKVTQAAPGDAHLSLAGAGPEEGQLREKCRALNLEKNVTFCGRLTHPDLVKLLRSADAYVAPSIGMEAFSIAALEAGCVGLPLILSDQVGLSDFLRPGEFSAYRAKDIDRLTATLLAAQDRWKQAPLSEIQAQKVAQYQALEGRFAAEEVARQIVKLCQ